MTWKNLFTQLSKSQENITLAYKGEYLELEDTVTIKANEFGVWFWEDFYSIDAKKVSKPVDFNIYTKVYKDFEGVTSINNQLLLQTFN